MSLLTKHANGGTRVPVHAMRRVQALLGSQEIAFADVDLQPGDRGTTTGEIIVFTPTRVIHARLKDAPNGPQSASSATTMSVEASTWGRSELRRVDLFSSTEPWKNPDQEWSEDYEDWWPRDCYADLSYSSGQHVRLPLGTQPTDAARKTMRSLLGSIAGDLE
ncbi:hypothetical protein [Aeromicrobium sp. CF3.5]|uniref:hypothetical protein n=1 Tax=Aeromicrobium sp. CF3.5 TaxID=3373078 RepID=UPI003EE66373